MPRIYASTFMIAVLMVAVLGNFARAAQPGAFILEIELRETQTTAPAGAQTSPTDAAPPSAASQPSMEAKERDSATPVAIKQMVHVGEPYFAQLALNGTVIELKGRVSKTTAGLLQTEVFLTLSEPTTILLRDGQQVTSQAVRQFASTYSLRMGEWTEAAASGAGLAGTDTWFVRVIAPGDDLSK
jgi:hypothetical protein